MEDGNDVVDIRRSAYRKERNTDGGVPWGTPCMT
jgi:hypothetical protein